MNPRAILQTVDHRPFPLPAGPWIMTQIWHHLLFAHWPLPPALLRPLVPAALELETFEGQCWLGLTPFRLTHLRPRGLPPFPGLSQFPEMNVRTYVRVKEIPGIYFFRLEAGNAASAALARWLFQLPYVAARMRCQQVDGWMEYESHRAPSDASHTHFVARYRPISPITYAQRGTLAYWLAERYCLYTLGSHAQVLRGNIHHRPWPLQEAELVIIRKELEVIPGFPFPEQPPLLHYASRQEVLVWPLQQA